MGTKAAEALYVLERPSGWYVRVRIPADLKEAYSSKTTHITRSLGTTSEAEALKLRFPAVAQIQAEFAEKRGTLGTIPRALLARQWYLPMAQVDKDAADLLVDQHLEEALEARGIEPATIGPALVAQVARVRSIITNPSPPVEPTIDQWVAEVSAGARLTEGTKKQYGSDARRFLGWAGKRCVLVSDMTRSLCGEYVSNGFDPQTSPKTKKRHVLALNGWWLWLRSKGLTAEEAGNPWEGQAPKIAKGRGSKADQAWRPFTTAEIVTLLSGLQVSPLPRLFRLGLFTGARISELCDLRASHVLDKGDEGLFLDITEGKTNAAVRLIPVHSAIRELLETMVREAPTASRGDADPYLFPNLAAYGYDKKRSRGPTERFIEERRRLEIPDGGPVFHSTRKNLLELMEAAEVPESTAKLVVGHERGSMTYGRYSKGVLVDLRAAIEKVVYPEAVMKAV